jgi:ribonuclease R
VHILADLLKKGNMGYSIRVNNETKQDVIVGTIITTRKGMGFIADPLNPDKDILVEEGFLNTALNGDTVEVGGFDMGRDKKGEKIKTAKVQKIIARAKENFVGTVDTEQGMYFLIPDDKKLYTDIVISNDDAKKNNIEKDQKVLVKINFDAWKDPKRNPQGAVVRVLGKKGVNDVEME